MLKIKKKLEKIEKNLESSEKINSFNGLCGVIEKKKINNSNKFLIF